MRSLQFLVLFFSTSLSGLGQQILEPDPSSAEFVTYDINGFWKAFDQIDSTKNPYREYLENGSKGLKDFIKYRIESPKNLLKTAINRKDDYEKIRENSYKVKSQTERIRDFYKVFKGLYMEAVFPPTYFVIGAFNSGGTSSENGLIIGVEMQNEIENIPYIVAHELIHFNQQYPGSSNLLHQSIMEGSADFIGELISGRNINASALDYFNQNEEMLCSEFVGIMNDSDYYGWLYGSKGKKEGRPNDLGYSIGYKICESYYDRSDNKLKAVKEILNIKNFDEFLSASGYLSVYIIK